MRVILNVNAPRPYIQGFEQVCNTIQGFESMKEMHPEDEFVIDFDSYEVYEEYMEKKVMAEVRDFCDENYISLEMLSAMIEWNSVKWNFLAPDYEEEDMALYEMEMDAWENYYLG